MELDDLHALLFGSQEQNVRSLKELIAKLQTWQNAADGRLRALEIKALPSRTIEKDDILGSRPSSSDQCGSLPRENEGYPIQGNIVPAYPGLKAKAGQKLPKVFDINNYRSRYVALEVMYIGWDYMGSTYQEGNDTTVEAKLIEALKHTRLVATEATLTDMQLSRCGRTDRGVSARGQVVALRIRSRARCHEEPLPCTAELDYTRILNRNLPATIQIIGWTDVSPNFDARFSTRSREYRYFIPYSQGELDVVAMKTAASSFVGEHDFRNFCKVDAEHVHHFVRHILDFRIEEVADCNLGDMHVLQVHIKGSAFLWHQVRCMVAVLIMVGKRQEHESIVSQLLDVEGWGCKPQYKMADEDPLLFYACNFLDLHFQSSQEALHRSLESTMHLLHSQLARTTLLHCLAQKIRMRLESCQEARAGTNGMSGLLQKHIQLKNRGREPSLEEKFAKFGRVLDPTASSRHHVAVE